MTLILSGACGNVNPPTVGVAYDQMLSFAKDISDSILVNLENEWIPLGHQPFFHVLSEKIKLPVPEWSLLQIDLFAQSCAKDHEAIREFGQPYILAVDEWKRRFIENFSVPSESAFNVEITFLVLDHYVFALVNAEIFSHIMESITTGKMKVYAIGSTNGTIGYIPDQSAYDVKSYENLWSCFFYNSPMIQAGTLEKIASCINEQINKYTGLPDSVFMPFSKWHGFKKISIS